MKIVNENLNQTANVRETLGELTGYLKGFIYPNLTANERIEFDQGLKDWVEKNK